ncbi:hypothetical protein ACS5PN_05190 [Roseateles sp. NT4]|uniref:hypothetical protein n=1 Tax=Roseateles sp. NT4 TaxID=3453715 RepID=UPI003EEE7F76
MKRWLKFALLLNAIGGGFAGFVALLPLWVNTPGGPLGYLLLLGMGGLFVLGIYSGWRLSQDERDGVPWVKSYLFLQLPYVSSPLVGYELFSAFAFRFSFGIVDGGVVTMTTSPFLGSVAWVSFSQGAPYGLGVNLVALILIILVSRMREEAPVVSAMAQNARDCPGG